MSRSRHAKRAGFGRDCLELTVDEAADGAAAVRINPYQQTRLAQVWLIMGKGLAAEEVRKAVATGGRIGSFQASGEGLGRGTSAQRQHLRGLQQLLDTPTQACPKFHLSGD